MKEKLGSTLRKHRGTYTAFPIRNCKPSGRSCSYIPTHTSRVQIKGTEEILDRHADGISQQHTIKKPVRNDRQIKFSRLQKAKERECQMHASILPGQTEAGRPGPASAGGSRGS